MKVISLIGNRPQYIKEAVLCQEFKKNNINEIIVDSGQHYDYNMSGIFLKSLHIKKPKYNLKVGSGSHGQTTGKIIIRFEKILQEEKPDLVLIYGDTNTTLAGAIVASKMGIKIAHVESGIRMLPKDMPEEINRTLVDTVSNFLFCSSKEAIQNLKKENIVDNVFLSGDIVLDLFLKMKKQFKYTIYKQLKLKKNKYVLVTLHRNYNVDNKEKLKKILSQLDKINQHIPVVFSMHPRTKKMINKFRLKRYIKDWNVIEPLEYLKLMGLLMNCSSVITDSGGLQKEAYFANKHSCVIMPDALAQELINHKWNRLCNEDNLFDVFMQGYKKLYIKNVYGNGKAGSKIVKVLKDLLVS